MAKTQGGGGTENYRFRNPVTEKLQKEAMYAERLVSVGHAQSILEDSVSGVNGAELPPGESGEVCARGDVVKSGYWNDPEATAGSPPAMWEGRAGGPGPDCPRSDGWLATGDVGRLGDAGFLASVSYSPDNRVGSRFVEVTVIGGSGKLME